MVRARVDAHQTLFEREPTNVHDGRHRVRVRPNLVELAFQTVRARDSDLRLFREFEPRVGQKNVDIVHEQHHQLRSVFDVRSLVHAFFVLLGANTDMKIVVEFIEHDQTA